MRPKHLVSIVLIAVVLVMLMRNNNSMTNARPLVYRESLDEVAAQINGEKLTLRDMAFYVGYEEYQIQQEALVYDPDDPNRYWSMRVEGGFMNAVARKNAMQMALHDELFYQMAMEEGITLDDNDQKHMDNKRSKELHTPRNIRRCMHSCITVPMTIMRIWRIPIRSF